MDLARELARRLGVPLEMIPFESAGKMAEAVKSGAWDVAFLAIDPARAKEINFSAPFTEIESTYLVPASPRLNGCAGGGDEVERGAVVSSLTP